MLDVATLLFLFFITKVLKVFREEVMVAIYKRELVFGLVLWRFLAHQGVG